MEPAVPPLQATATGVCRESRTAAIILDRYKLGRQLGRGSFAKVFLAKSLIDDSSVAVKIIDKPECADMQSRITREISAMRRLQHHPNILKIHEVMATKSKIYLVMELARGGELFAKIASRGRLTEPAARKYFQQLVSTLDFCHQNGVTHRDVKPQNLLLDQNNNLKVSDFGLSALPEQIKDGLLRTACGTPAYTAPEVVCRRNGGYDGSKADAWSCGVLLFFFLAGFLPFDDTNLIDMYTKIHKREYSFPEWMSRPVKRIIWHLLDPNPNTRLSIELLKSTNWFKKSPQPEPKITLTESDSYFGKNSALRPMNAFDIIS
uniref:Protein kinase domain-containing protein n=1 Tax=Kalanchoe fedtschenkoi TaxID=63787 RepID=A0A7N0VKW0_KALFE